MTFKIAPRHLLFTCILWQAVAGTHRLHSGLPQDALQPWQPPEEGRRLQQQSKPALIPRPAQPATGTAVVSIISNATNYWPYLCVNSCSQVSR